MASELADIFAFATLAQILEGKRPPKPPVAEQLGLDEEMWTFNGKCWCANQNKRPAIDEVVRV